MVKYLYLIKGGVIILFPDKIVEIIQKYKLYNQSSIIDINDNLLKIITDLESINMSIIDKITKLLVDKNTDNNVESLVHDSIDLRNFKNSIKLLDVELYDNVPDETDTLEESSIIFDKKVYPYLVSDDICPFCNVKLMPYTIYYQRIISGKINSESVMWYRCPACKKLFAIDYDIEDFDFENTSIDLNKSKYNEIPQIDFYSAIVLSNTLKCSLNHRSKDLIAKIPILNEDGEFSYLKINASYCPICHRFTILKEDFSTIKDIILCRVIDETTEYKNNSNNDIEIEQKQSILYQYGYNVQTKKNISEKQRHIILSSIIEGQIMTRRDVINHINTLIDRGTKIPSWKNATQKWKDDKQFVSEYKSDTLPEVIFKNIILKYNK